MTTQRAWFATSLISFLALALILLPHWGMSFSNADDPWITQLGFQGSIDTAKTQGRFWLVPVLLLAQLPYLFDSLVLANIIKISVNGLTLLSFVLFCAKLTNKNFGVLTGLIWLALIDINSSSYSPIHGFLLMFNVQFLFLFLSFYTYLLSMEQIKSGKIVVVPYLLFGFAMLAYEPMAFYALAFPALYLYTQYCQQETSNKLKLFDHAITFLKHNFILLIVLSLYVVLYVGFRKYYASGSRGLDQWSSFAEVFKTIYSFSIHGFHLQIKPLTSAATELYTTSGLVLAACFASLITIGMYLVVPRIDNNLTPIGLYKKTSLLFLIFFLFSPNILFGLVEGYRKWANYDPHYVGNYFSSFPLAMIIALLVLYLVGGSKAKQEKILFVLVLYVFFMSSMENYLRWDKLASANREGTVLWQRAIEQLEAQTLQGDNATLVCGINPPKQVAGDNRYWSNVLSRKFSSDIRYVSNKLDTTACNAVIDFQRLHAENKKSTN